MENGGGMSLLAGALGYAQLTEPVRFQAVWEQEATLRLCDGDTSVLAEYALRRELNRRIREDLITLGIVSDSPGVTIADATQASPGDLLICTRNDHGVEAGESGRTLANGDLLRIEAITRDGLIARRALDANRGTGQRRWTDRHFLFNSYKDAELGYAVTDHAAQSRTVTAGLMPLSAMVEACAASLP